MTTLGPLASATREFMSALKSYVQAEVDERTAADVDSDSMGTYFEEQRLEKSVAGLFDALEKEARFKRSR